MGYLKDKRVYLAGPIMAASDDGVGWRKSVTPHLEQYGLDVDDPTEKMADGTSEILDDKEMFISMAKNRQFTELKKLFAPIVHKDLRCVDKADFIIVVYDPTIHTFGTIHELVVASQQRKPILMFCAEEHLDSFNPWATVFIKEGCLFTNWQDVLGYLDRADSGDIDKDYWTLGD